MWSLWRPATVGFRNTMSHRGLSPKPGLGPGQTYREERQEAANILGEDAKQVQLLSPLKPGRCMGGPVALGSGNAPGLPAEAHGQCELFPQTQGLLCPECLATQLQRAPRSRPAAKSAE